MRIQSIKRPIKCQSRSWSQAGTKFNGSHHGDKTRYSDRFSVSMEMSRLARDGTAEPVSRDQIIRHARGQGNIIFPGQLTTSRIGNLTRLIHTLLYVMTIHTYIHTHRDPNRHKTLAWSTQPRKSETRRRQEDVLTKVYTVLRAASVPESVLQATEKTVWCAAHPMKKSSKVIQNVF